MGYFNYVSNWKSPNKYLFCVDFLILPAGVLHMKLIIHVYYSYYVLNWNPRNKYLFYIDFLIPPCRCAPLPVDVLHMKLIVMHSYYILIMFRIGILQIFMYFTEISSSLPVGVLHSL